jgi:alkylated DNA repair protein (DNA oxidative demethylase)
MSRVEGAALKDLLMGTDTAHSRTETLGEGAVLLCGFALPDANALWHAVERIAAKAPFRHMITPGGYRMSVGMTNCGRAGWITDRRGYRYDTIDPETQRPWPAMPVVIERLATRAAEAAGFAGFAPDACLINRYEPGARLTLHQDKNERDFAQPIVSVSLGLPAVFLFGGLQRNGPPRRLVVESGDVAVWGGAARLAFHGIEKLAGGENPLTGNCRINLTLRKAL